MKKLLCKLFGHKKIIRFTSKCETIHCDRCRLILRVKKYD